MSAVESLARVLDPAESFTDTDGEASLRILSGKRLAERILADPGPLLAALAEAGVLTVEWSDQEREHIRQVLDLYSADLLSLEEAETALLASSLPWRPAQAAARAWDEGYQAGWTDGAQTPTHNPYRIERGES